MKCLRKQTNCAVFADFRDAAFAQTGPNSGFVRDFFAQNGDSVQSFVRFIYFLERLKRNFEPRNLFFEPRIFFSGLGRKNLGTGTFSRRLRGRFSFPLELFPEHVSRVISSAESSGGFPAGRTSAPGVSRAPSKGQVWRGFRDILIPIRRVWLRSFRAVPARRPDTRISEAENEQIVNAHPKMSLYII